MKIMDNNLEIDPHSPARRGKRLSELDALRFLAAASVVFYHLIFGHIQLAESQSALWLAIFNSSRFGYIGVDLFFIISGFVIIMTATKRSPIGFAVHRIIRLYPTFWIAVVVTTTLVWITRPSTAPIIDLRTFLANLTMLPGYMGQSYIDGVYWTLAIEIKFYFLVFALMLFGQVRYAEYWAYFWLLLLAIAEFGTGGSGLRSLIIAPFGASFAGGALLFLVYEKGWSAARAIGIAVALALAVLAADNRVVGFIRNPRQIDMVIAQMLTASCFVLIAICATFPGRFVTQRLWSQAGAITYPLYLIHAHIGFILFEKWENALSPFGALIAVLVSVSIISIALSVVSEQGFVPKLGRSRFAKRLAREGAAT